MSESFELQHRAKEIRLKREEKVLEIDFEDGKTFSLRAELLRVESPSAEVRGHGSGPRPPQPPVPDDISVLGAEPVGRYAVRIQFSDGHDSGLYTWKFLRELAVPA